MRWEVNVRNGSIIQLDNKIGIWIRY
jgi:hypothetical protein